LNVEEFTCLLAKTINIRYRCIYYSICGIIYDL